MLFHMMSSELNDNSLIIFLEYNKIIIFLHFSGIHFIKNPIMLCLRTTIML